MNFGPSAPGSNAYGRKLGVQWSPGAAWETTRGSGNGKSLAGFIRDYGASLPDAFEPVAGVRGVWVNSEYRDEVAAFRAHNVQRILAYVDAFGYAGGSAGAIEQLGQSDVDGTLMGGFPRPQEHLELRRLKRIGVAVPAVTARSRDTALGPLTWLQAPGAMGPQTFCQGALVMNGDDVLHHSPLPYAAVDKIHRVLAGFTSARGLSNEERPLFEIYLHGEHWAVRSRYTYGNRFPRYGDIPGGLKEFPDLAAMLAKLNGRDPTKIAVVCGPNHVSALVTRLQRGLRATADVVKSGEFVIEITKAGVDKRIGMRKVEEWYGLPTVAA